jgi:hypothetical protein
MPTDKKNQLGIDFYNKDGKLIAVNKDGEAFELDFDTKKGVLSADTSQPPNNKKKNESKMKLKKKVSREDIEDTEDLTDKQVEEHYWNTTPLTKLDGSTAMMEARIHKCQEASDNSKTRETCSNEVKPRMIKAGSENTNTDMEDMTLDEVEGFKKKVRKADEKAEKKKKKEKKKDDETEDTEDTENVEVCKDKLDFLEDFYEKNKVVKEDNDTLQEKYNKLRADMVPMMDFITDAKEREAKRIETEVNNSIKSLSEDFVIPEDKIREIIGEKTGKEALNVVSQHRDMLKLAVKPNGDNTNEATTEDFEEQLDFMQSKIKQAMEEDFLEL